MLGYSASKPLLVFGTRHGSVYNLTPSNLPYIGGIGLSLGDFYDNQQTIRNLPPTLPLKKFLGFPEDIVMYLTPYDFYKEGCMTGCQDSKYIKVKCSKGYTPFDHKIYDDMVMLLRPQIYVAMTEYPAIEKDHKQDSNKSYKRAILKTKTYYENSQLVKSQKRPLLLGPLHGAKNLSLLARSLEDNLSNNVDGLIVCDICNHQNIEERQTIYNFIIERLKKEEKKYTLALAGLGKIEDIKHALKFGFSIFEINYPFLLAEKHQALIHDAKNNQYYTKIPQKSEVLKPLSQDCNCQSCKVHNQSYIAHLVECFEMNAKILLTIHNLEAYSQFMKSLQ